MRDNRQNRIVVAAIALLLVLAAVALGWVIFRGDPSLLREVSVEHPIITPNADGVTDATTIKYKLSRNGEVSIYFVDESGRKYFFRELQPRGVGDYGVLFSGIVQGYTLEGEEVNGEILARLLQDGNKSKENRE